MSKHRHALAARDAHIMTLRAIIAALLVACAGMWYGWQSAPTDLTVYNPPDLRSGSMRKWWEVPPSTVYSFALYIWQQINHWPEDGEKDFKNNLYSYSAYLTPSCRTQMSSNYQRRKDRNELTNRVRTLQEMPGYGYQPDDVTILDRNHWVVQMDTEIDEYLKGTPIRQLNVRYFMRVVRADVDPEANPFGLQLDCFAKPAIRLSVSHKGGNTP